MPFYSFHLNVPAQPDVVAERVRRVVSPAPTFWETLALSWRLRKASGSPFLGSVENLSFRIRRNIQYRNSFLPMIRGKITSAPTGSRIDVFMYMHPFSLVFMLVWFGLLVLTESRIVDANIARSFFPKGMAIFGLALSLGGFFFEALKVMPLLSEAVFNPEIVTVPVPNPESQLRAQSVPPRAELSSYRFSPVIATMAVLAGLALLYLYALRLRASPAFATAMNLVYTSVEAKAALGFPIRAGLGVQGMVHDWISSGYAVLSIPVSGPVGKGTLYVVANRVGTGWDIEREVLHTGEGSKSFDLTPTTRPEVFHYPATGRVYLLPLDDAAAFDIKDLPAYYMARLGLEVRLLPTQKLTPDTLSTNAKQLIAERVLMSMTEKHSETIADMDSEILGVTSQDINIQSADWRYATNYRSGRFGIVSTARFHGMPWYAGANPEVFAVRMRKMVTKNLVMLHYPVDLSADVTSALATSVFTTSDVDEMGESLGGQNGNAGLVSSGAPCVTIFQGSNGKQRWRLGCTSDNREDARFETFETYTSVPLLVMSRTDFSFKEQPFFPFVRKYRPQDDRSRPFGIGATDSFDIFPVGDSQTFAWIELILTSGQRIHYARTSLGAGVADAKFRAASSLGNPFSLSALKWNGDGWDLTTKDGWTYKFPSSGPDRTWQQGALIGLRSVTGKTFAIQRNHTGDLQEVRAPDGESIEFTYDAMHRITSGRQSSGHAIQYEYDAAGRLVHVRDSQNDDEFYEYDPVNRLVTVRNAQHQPLLVNTYGFLGEILSQTLADGEKVQYESGYSQDHQLMALKLTLPNGYTILWQLTRNGFVRSWPQPPADAGAGLPH
jgi:YD repeat-containing protein